MKKTTKLRHESLQRLLEVAKEIKGIEGPAALAAVLIESEQTVTNWGRRGVSLSGAIKAQEKFGCSATWVLQGTGVRLIQPPGPKHQPPARAEEPAAIYTVISPAQAVGALTESLLAMEGPESRETAGMYLQKMASHPHGRWAALLVDLIEKEAVHPVNITGEGLPQPKALPTPLKLADTGNQGRGPDGPAQTVAQSPVIDDEKGKGDAAARDKPRGDESRGV